VDNGVIDGTAMVTIAASENASPTAYASISIGDNDNQLFVSLPAAGGWEGQTLTNAGTVRIATALPYTMTVNLASNDASELSVPGAMAIIPAGQTFANFSLSMLLDGIQDGAQMPNVIASAAGFTPGSGSLTVHDSDLHHLAMNMINGVETAGWDFNAGATARNIDNEIIATYNGTGTLSAAGQGGSLSVTPTTITFSAGGWFGGATV